MEQDKYLEKLKLQLFADGNEGSQEGTSEVEGTGEKKGSDDSDGSKVKTYTDDDIAALKAEWEKGISEKIETAKKEGMTEAERLAKLTDDEKKAEELKKLQETIEGYKKKEQLQLLKNEAKRQLEAEKLPEAFTDIVLGKDAENTKSNIKNLKTSFYEEVQKAVEERLKGKTPKAGGSGDSKETDIKEQFKKALKGGF